MPVVTAPIAQNPPRYSPAITATFSEALDPSTVNTSTFKVVGLTGSVFYDEQTKTAVFMPLSPLVSSKSYTAQLTAGIKDKMGNAMSPYSWQFASGSPANMVVTLPLGEPELNFGSLTVNALSPAKTVSLINTGVSNLIMGTVSLTGVNSANYIIIEGQMFREKFRAVSELHGEGGLPTPLHRPERWVPFHPFE